MFQLKDYQQRALDSLRVYFAECNRIGNADTAFYELTRENFGAGIPYRPVKELPGLPYVCIRIPTGGGKTVVACYTVGLAAKDLLHADRCVVLWLVPSNTIREQTLRALKDVQHPYRQALEATTGSVSVLDIGEALYIQRPTLDTETTIIVSTMQAFRVEDTDGRKVYEGNGALMGHFTDLPDAMLEGVSRLEDGSTISSLANVLRIRRPVVIVDEAHNARTGLSFETLARFNPSCIVEFTATPDIDTNPSNVLHSVSAAELKAEDMIKMPIRLDTRVDWRELIADAVALRNRLEKIADTEHQETGEYIRPIMLLQAQPKRKDANTLTVDVVKQCLLDDYKIPETQIAIETGSLKELGDIDLNDAKCEIRYVITVQALREGWDCPFAYVLCSVAEMKSSTYVEQILGRVMRLPRAAKKSHGELNFAYAFAASSNFFEAANALTDALVENGFNRQEAGDFVKPLQPDQLPLLALPLLPFTYPLAEAPRIEKLSKETAAKVVYDAGASTLTFKGVMSESNREELKNCFGTTEGKQVVEEIYRLSRGYSPVEVRTPAERGETLSIPVLAVKQADLFEQFEATHFLEAPWSLADCDAALSEKEFSSERPKGQEGEITLNERGRVEARFLTDLQQQMSLLSPEEGWTVGELVYWLDRSIPHVDITPTESGLFLTRLVRHVSDTRGLAIDVLAHDKYRLRQAIVVRIDELRRHAHQEAYQKLLLPDSTTPLVVNPAVCFSFDPQNYPYNTLYRGTYKFQKHYYRHVGDFKSEGEQFACAQFIDSLPQVKFWVRNLERRPSHSFWFQTSSDRFYPDFVCLLEDGRCLVVEFKGEDRWSNDDSKEKRDIGELWEARSGGTCLFVMPKGKDWNAITSKIKK